MMIGMSRLYGNAASCDTPQSFGRKKNCMAFEMKQDISLTDGPDIEMSKSMRGEI